jgi:hypothetical protein
VKSDREMLVSKLGTLADADISSRRVSRRSLLATFGLGAGVAVAAVLGATPVEAQSDGGGRGRRCAPPCTDAAPSDRAGWGRCRVRRGCTDSD